MNTPNSSEPKPKRARRIHPAIWTLLVFKLVIVLLVAFVFIFMVATTPGAQFTLGLLERFAGIQVQGVSGSLIHQLAIGRIELHNKNVDLVADNVELQWQLKALWDRQLQLDYVRVNNLQLDITSSKEQDNEMTVSLPDSLKLPRLLKLLTADQLTVDSLQLNLLDENRQPENTQQFSALKAKLLINPTKYQLQFSGTTPWGSTVLNGGFETTAPFNTEALFDWQGLATVQSGVAVPATDVHGTLSGSWQELLVQAKVKVASDSATSGHVSVVLTPFKKLPVESLQVDLNSVNPASFYADAPKGNLQLQADFKITEDKKSPTLHGQFSIKNSQPATWDSGGIPFAKLSSELTANEHQVSWQAMKMELEEGGLVTGSGNLNLDGLHESRALTHGGISNNQTSASSFPRRRESSMVRNSAQAEQPSNTVAAASLARGNALGLDSRLRGNDDKEVSAYAVEGEGVSLPDLTASVDLKNINLLRIDSRLKKTKLNGTIQTESEKTGLQFALNLQDIQSKSLEANLVADVHLSHDQVLSLNKIELRAKDAILTAQGTVALRDKQEFKLQGEARNLNPARWINVPEGRIATRFNVTGQIQHGWRVAAKINELSGQFAGLNLQGESDLLAQQDKLISIKKLDLNWGKNHLSAKGNWSLTGAGQHDQLQFNLALSELSELSEPFKKIMPAARKDRFQGSLFIDGILSGNSMQPGGQLNIKADKLTIPGAIELEKLQATVALAGGAQGKMEGKLDATGLNIGGTPSKGDGVEITQLQANLSGIRHAHQLQLNAVLPRKYQIALQAKGDLREKRSGGAQWQGSVQQFDLSGPSDLQLASPFNLQISSDVVQLGAANWQGKLGKLQVQQIDWAHGQLKTKGQLQSLSVVNALKLWGARLPVMGDLLVDAGWDFVVGQKAEGQFEVKRTSGDLILQDVSGGYSQTFAMGLQNLLVTGRVGQAGVVAQPVELQLNVVGNQLGQIEARFRSSINRTAQGWSFAANAPLSGSAKLQSNDIQWLGQLMGSGTTGVTLRGELQAQAEFAGTMQHPIYSAQIKGKELQVSIAELGVLLPNGILDASLEANLERTELKLNKLQFSQEIKAPQVNQKSQEQLIDFSKLGLLKETGVAEASGEIDLRTGRGSIKAHWQRFPFLQTEQGWLVATGDAQLTETEKAWNLTGQLLADAAYFSVPKQAPPKLSSDVVVIRKNDKRSVASVEKETGMQSSVDFNIKTGNNFVFNGRGLNTRLAGDLRIRIQNDGPVLATGSIQTIGGTYEGYGQQLAIERGILNFQGPLDNPTLNVRALRRGLPVEAGVEVVGTVAKPEVRLISEPNVPDQDKLSWMVLGHGSDQMGGSEAGLLMTAATAILGGDSDSNIPREIARTFGLDDISVSTSSVSPDSQLPSQTVAGNIANSTTTDQVFSVGKHITPDLVFSVERSLTDATNGVKLTWKLTRGFSIIGRAGSDTSMDGQYLFSFN